MKFDSRRTIWRTISRRCRKKCQGQVERLSKSPWDGEREGGKRRAGFPGDLWKTNNCQRCQSQTSLVESPWPHDGALLSQGYFLMKICRFIPSSLVPRLSRARLIFKRIEVYPEASIFFFSFSLSLSLSLSSAMEKDS